MTKLRAREIYNNSRLMLIAIESVEFHHNKTNKVYRLFGNLKPIALVVYSPDTMYALDMEAKPVALEQLKRDVPELEIIITSFNKL